MTNTINFKRVRQLNARLQGNDEPEDEKFLFVYAVNTFIQGESYSNLSDEEAEAKLKENSDTEIYLCYLKSSTPEVPSFLKGKKYKKLEVTSHEGLSDKIFSITGVRVPDMELTTQQEPPAQPVDRVTKIMNLKASVDASMKRRAEIQRIKNCLAINDARRRKDCLNNCKNQ